MNPIEYRKRVKSGQVPKKGSNLGKYQRRVQASTERVIEFGQVPEESGRVPEKGRIQASTKKGSNQSEYQKSPGEYQGKKEFEQLPNKFLGKYKKRARVSIVEPKMKGGNRDD